MDLSGEWTLGFVVGRHPVPTFFDPLEDATMKQKNMIAIAVAVGFGLIAMFLVMRITPTATPAPVEELVEIPVPAKEIPPNTKLTKELLPPESAEWITMKKVSKTSLPSSGYVGSIAELTDKRATQVLHTDSVIAPTDVSNRTAVEIPKGMNMYTIPIGGTSAAAGFAIPGMNVDILATFQLRKTKGPTVFPLLRDMKIIAVDHVTATGPGQNAIAYGSVSFAATKKQSMILKLATERGASLSFLLPSTDGTDNYPPDVPKGEEEVWKILESEFGSSKEDGGEEKAPTKVAVAIFKADLKAGTQITEDLLAEEGGKIGMIEVSLPKPAGTIDNPRAKDKDGKSKYLGKFIRKDVQAMQFLVEDLLEDEYKQPKDVAKGKVGPTEGPGEKPADPTIPEDTKPVPIPVFHDVTIQTASGARTFRYQELKGGKWKYMGPAPIDVGPIKELEEPKSPKKETAPDPKKPVL